MLDEEDGHLDLLRALLAASKAGIGAPTLFEAMMVLQVKKGAIACVALSRFLEENDVKSIPFERGHAELASRAFTRYGKGRHPARLNFGDCMTYATARIADAPLLYVGEDFAKTDLDAA
jgi:ribonuclease VapC